VNFVTLLMSPETGWVALGLFVAGLYGFAVRMTHLNAAKGRTPRTRTGEFRRVGLANGSERRNTSEIRPVTDTRPRTTAELRPVAAPRQPVSLPQRPAPLRTAPVAVQPGMPRAMARPQG
jgi:hypothetical protein